MMLPTGPRRIQCRHRPSAITIVAVSDNGKRHVFQGGSAVSHIMLCDLHRGAQKLRERLLASLWQRVHSASSGLAIALASRRRCSLVVVTTWRISASATRDSGPTASRPVAAAWLSRSPRSGRSIANSRATVRLLLPVWCGGLVGDGGDGEGSVSDQSGLVWLVPAGGRSGDGTWDRCFPRRRNGKSDGDSVRPRLPSSAQSALSVAGGCDSGLAPSACQRRQHIRQIAAHSRARSGLSRARSCSPAPFVSKGKCWCSRFDGSIIVPFGG